VQSPAWDGLWLFSGLWAPLVALALFWIARAGVGPEVTLDSPGFDPTAIAWLYLPLSILHRLTTTYAVLCTPILRDELRKDPARYLYVPAAILVGCVGLSVAFVFHDAFAFLPGRHGRMWAFFVLAYVMILWERWHFCAQEFGVLSIYRIRARQHGAADKRFDRLYTNALMLGVNMCLYVCLGFSDETRVLLHGVDLSSRQAVLDALAVGAVTVAATLLLYAVLRELRHPQRSLPKLLFYVLVGSHSLLLYLAPRALGLFFLSYMLHHWMVSVGLFGRVVLTAYDRQLGSFAAALRRVTLHVAPLTAAVVLWYLFFEPLNKAGNLAPVPTETDFTGAATGARLLAGAVIGVFFALNYLHYYYDRCLYAFSTPAIRKTVTPLLLGAPADRD
jgi:hypothetical protein